MTENRIQRGFNIKYYMKLLRLMSRKLRTIELKQMRKKKPV